MHHALLVSVYSNLLFKALL